MILLSDIQFKSKKKIENQSKKFIKFSRNSTIVQSKIFGSVLSNNNIKWTQTLKMPQAYNTDIFFQIYNVHEFGYNPDELGTVLTGKLKIHPYQNIINTQVYSAERPDLIVGTLTLHAQKENHQQKHTGKSKNQVIMQTGFANPEQDSSYYKVVTSILIRNLENPPLKGFITIQVQQGNKTYKSQMIQPLRGQFMFFIKSKTGTPLLKTNNFSTKAWIEFHSQNGKTQGKSQFSFLSEKKVNRLELVNPQRKVVGQVYLQLEKRQTNYTGPKPNASPNLGAEQNKSSAIKQQTVLLGKFRSMSEAQLTRMGESQFLGTSRKKTMSVFHRNNDIVFPSERRFQLYQDKQTNIISYSNLPSMKFEQQHSHKYYRGASMGKGNKQDFTRYYKQNPGVGQYKLPSIFDRY